MTTKDFQTQKTMMEETDIQTPSCRSSPRASARPAPRKYKWKPSKEKQLIDAACKRHGVLGEKSRRDGKGSQRVRAIHRNIGSLKSIFALGLEEM
jgi:hypothetical protein